MTPEQHLRCSEVFFEVCALPDDERPAALARLCGDDAELRAEVESLLAHVSSDNRTELLGFRLSALIQATAHKSPLPQDFGPYRIQRLLGEGGMGVVYLARDTRLDRNVAIKALPAHLASDTARLARFEREAKALASLNHSNIGAIYGIEEDHGQRYLVLEYIEGETLGEYLQRGSVAPDEAIDIAVHIAEALEAAHERGVIHRDLKPGNIMITPDGAVKVLDFGLARTIEVTSLSFAPPDENSPTRTSPATQQSPTIPGAIMGTAGYMSPEQARGKVVDKRSDIFSFGCVLYEMLTGMQPFQGESIADSMGATLHKEPDWSLLPPGTPPTVRMLLARCLAKDRHKRIHDIADARIELEHAIDDPTMSMLGLDGHVSGMAARRGLTLAAIAAVFILLAAGAMAFMRLAATPPIATLDHAVRFTISSKGEGYTAVSRYAWVSETAISPDGRHIVFTAIGADNTRRLWVRPLDSVEARVLHDTANAEYPFWCEDSRSIGFFENGRLWRIHVDGGARRLITNVDDYEWGAAWNSDGVILIGQMGSGLMQVDASGGTPRSITTLSEEHFEGGHTRPHFLPDGERFIFNAMTFDPDKEAPLRRMYEGRLGSDQITLIAEMTTSQVWYVNPNLLMYVDDGKVMAAPFDSRSMRFTGAATTVAEGCAYFGATGLSRLSVSRDGTIVFGQPIINDALVWVDETGARLGTLVGPGIYEAFRISPNGESVAVAVLDPRTYMGEIWLYGLTRTTRTRLHARGWWHGWPAWSPDSSTVYFAWARPAAPDIFSARADGVGGIEPVYRIGNAVFPNDVSRDGKWLVLMSDPLQTRVVPLHGVGEGDFPPIQGWLARVSPDGEFIAYISDVTGRTQVYVERFMGGTARVQISIDGGTHPVWAADGSRLFFQQPSIERPWGGTKMMVVDVSEPNWLNHPQPHLLFESAELFDKFDVAPEGNRFLLKVVPAEMPPTHVIANWPRQWAKSR